MQQFFPSSQRAPSRPSRRGQTLSAIVAALAVILMAAPARADKLRDLCDVLGARDNQLVGYGVVTGLNGTGDDIMVPYAAQSLRSLMRRLGIQVDSSQVRLRNVAAVIVTATLPAFVRPGSRIDVTVSSMGNAKSLRGGVLIQTPLRGADRKTYAVGQGSLVVGGFSAAGFNGSYLQQNVTTTGRVPTGALVEREIKANFENKGKLTLALRIPDFGTASRVVEALEKSLGKGSALALDGGAIEVTGDPKESPVELLAKLGDLDVDPVTSARVVINERTGTIVAGGDVHLSPVAIAQGGISISVQETRDVSQPGAFATAGQTRVVQNSDVQANEKSSPTLSYIKGAATLADVAQALSTLGVSPRDMASILQALKGAGALRAEILVQ